MKQNYFPKVDIRGRVRVCLETLLSVGVKGKYVVDVGSSIGWLEKELLKYRPKKLVGIEPDLDAVIYSRKKVKEATFINSNAGSIPVPDSSVDVVIMFDVLEHVPKNTESTVLKEINRILKRGGKLVLSTPHDTLFLKILDLAWYFGHRHYKKEYLKSLIKRSGFVVTKLELRGGYWFSLYLVWHYVMKWIFKKPLATNEFLLRKDDEQFSQKKGINTIFLIATKL